METGHPLNRLSARVRTDERFAHGDTVHGIAEGRPVRLVAAEPRASVEYLIHANELYRYPGGPPVPALQVVWPDCGGRYPWDPPLPGPATPTLQPASRARLTPRQTTPQAAA